MLLQLGMYATWYLPDHASSEHADVLYSNRLEFTSADLCWTMLTLQVAGWPNNRQSSCHIDKNFLACR